MPIEVVEALGQLQGATAHQEATHPITMLVPEQERTVLDLLPGLRRQERPLIEIPEAVVLEVVVVIGLDVVLEAPTVAIEVLEAAVEVAEA